MHGILYRSAPMSPVDWALMLDIVRASERNNRRDRLSGVLHWSEEAFVQLLSGPQPGLAACLRRLRADPRHDIAWVRPVNATPPWPAMALPMGYVSAADVGATAASLIAMAGPDDAEATAATLMRWTRRKYPSLTMDRPAFMAIPAASAHRAAAPADEREASAAG